MPVAVEDINVILPSAQPLMKTRKLTHDVLDHLMNRIAGSEASAWLGVEQHSRARVATSPGATGFTGSAHRYLPPLT